MAHLVEENIKSTLDRPLGLLINGVELYSPSVLNESIYFGEITEVEILNSGVNYDVINPPELEILDLEGYGSGAKIHANMKGKLTEVVVLSSGIGYDRKPSLSLVGGNFNGGAELETNLIKKIITSRFIPSTVGVSATSITFIENHNFQTGEEIIYNSNSYPGVVGLVTNSSYFARVLTSKTISLHNNSVDAINNVGAITSLATVVGVNTGIQEFSTRNVKNIIDKVYINSFTGELYSKTVKIPSIENSEVNEVNGVNITSDFIYAKNHNLREKDLVVYSSTGTEIVGLASTTQYYVTLLDKNRFKLSSDEENYNNKIYSSLNSVGVGTHTFSYPPIEILVSTVPGITSSIAPQLEPVVLGSFESIFIEDNGVGYGVSEVINLNKFPITRIVDSSEDLAALRDEAVLQPIIINGKIVDVNILNAGNNYGNDIDIIVDGVGKYAKLYPIVQNKKITKVFVLSSGDGYVSGKTKLTVKRRGTDAKFLSSIKKWTINQYFKNKATIESDISNGFIIPSRNVEKSLQIINFFASKELRDSVKDNRSTNKSSPILGWAYDGTPIIGPDIYSNSQFRTATSGYEIKSNIETLSGSLKRPPSSTFSAGYFIDDYQYNPDLTDLDEHNGMYVDDRDDITKGTYAYFITLDSEGNPAYPYVIGNTFKNNPNLINFDSTYNQNVDFSNKKYLKNTNPLYLSSPNSGYEFLQEVKDNYKQDIIVTNTLSSNIDEIKILDAGEDYKVGDKINFEITNDQDIYPSAYISRVSGKPITTIQVGITTYNNITFKNQNNKIIGLSTSLITIENGNVVSISSATNSTLNGNVVANIKNKVVKLESSHNASGITTYIKVNDISGFSVDDYIKIDDEIVKIIEIYPQKSQFFVHRSGTLGIHTSGTSFVTLLPTKFEFNNNKITEDLTVDNKKYFNPRLSVGLGTTGSYIVNEITNTSYSVLQQTIYIPNHQFESNQTLTYNFTGTGTNGILVSNQGSGGSTFRLQNGQTVYAINLGRDYLGISTIGYGATALYFRESSYNTDEIHSFNYTESTVTGKVELNNLLITTEESHNLLSNDLIKLNGKEGEWEDYVVKFDFNGEYKIKKTSSTGFSINLNRKPEFISFAEKNSIQIKELNPNNVTYTTNSKNTQGSISNINIISSSKYYDTAPIVKTIFTENGKDANLLAYSNTIGKIDSVERIKDGFDYPSDITLQPKLSTNTICYLDNTNSINKVDVLFGGLNYNTPPTLKVIGDETIKLSAKLRNSTVTSVNVDINSNNLSKPLEIISINNSNGFDILEITAGISSNTNRIEIDINQFPLIYRDYDEPIVDFPFKVKDLIFIENCRILETDKPNYNSTDYSNSFFEVVGINSSLGYIDYKIVGVSTFGTYDFINGYGTVVNKKSLPTFKMTLKGNNYIEGENVKVLDEENNVKFSGIVMTKNGWDSEKKQLRLSQTKGKLDEGDVLLGSKSFLKGKVLYSNSFTMKAFLGSTRNKINYKNVTVEDLNSDIKKLQDSYYYQDFSYSIKGFTQYETWRESVKSIVHPSGFKEFSDLQIISDSNNNLKVSIGSSGVELNIDIQNENSFYTKNNYFLGYEDEKINPTTIERVYLGSGDDLWPIAGFWSEQNLNYDSVKGKKILSYLTNISNNVIPLKDISSEFTGTYDYTSLGNRDVEFNSNSPYFLGITTTGLEIGDLIGYSTYHEYPNQTKIISVGINSIQILYPHKVYSGIVTESLEIIRNLNQNNLIGITSFTLKAEDDTPVYSVVGAASSVNLTENLINLKHNFETGQRIYYENIGGTPIGIQTTTEVIGGISTNVLPPIVYGIKITEDKFKLSGLSTTPLLTPLSITSSGSGVHKFIFDSPNSSTLITIDNIIQTPVHYRGLSVNISGSVGVGTTLIYSSSGISSLSSIDILKIDDEYLKIISVGIGSTNSIQVERGFLGTVETSHTGVITATVYRGNYLIDEDVVYFTSPPFGPSGLPGLEVSSKFTGRAFSRSFKSTRPNDKNIVLDDISDQFTGISSFTLTENGNNVVGLYTNTNSYPSLTNISNNPIILVNNISQVSNLNYEITTEGQNKIQFLNGVPNSGKILRFESNQGYGYAPLIGAAATVAVSAAGTISAIYLNGAGSGYRTPPTVNIVSPIGYGASIQAAIGASGTITGLTVINPGAGYTTTYIPEVSIDIPLPYYDLDLSYKTGVTGIGSNAKVSVVVGSGSSIENIEITSPGQNYKVGDILKVVGLTTITGIGSTFSEFNITVKEVFSDTFSGIYPGQFLQFDDISGKFNSVRKIFDITTTINGEKTRITFVNQNQSKDIENHFFIFINDVLQKPKEAYRYIGGRLIFKEPPISGSLCNILYYQGSFEDTELVIPLQTIKEGDSVKLESSELNRNIFEQDERVVRRITSPNSFDTFSYSGVGISSNVARPITWTKQKNDKLISGSIVSKSRNEQLSKIYPTAKLIWNVKTTDESIYVDNAYPLFIELDNGINGIIEEKRNVIIINEDPFTPATIQSVNVSGTSTISSVNIDTSGSGYYFTPEVNISSPPFGIKDPLYNWNGTLGVTTTATFNSLVQGDVIIGVGSDKLVAISTDLTNWSLESVGYLPNIEIKKVGVSTQNSYVSVGSSGKILLKQDKDSPWSICGIKTELFSGFVSQGFSDSSYVGNFNDVKYNHYKDYWIVVGDQGKIYKNSGIGSTVFVECITPPEKHDYKSLDYNSVVMVAVGHSGISTSSNGIDWVGMEGISLSKYNCVLYDGYNFIITSDSGIYKLNNNGNNLISINPTPTDILKITKYDNLYVGVSSIGKVYHSFNLADWEPRNVPNASEIKEIKTISLNDSYYQGAVGTSGTIIYSIPTKNKAILQSNIINGQVDSITVVNPGFGYSAGLPPEVIIEGAKSQSEILYTISAVGDFGKIVGIATSSSGIGTDSPSIKFELSSEYSTTGYNSGTIPGINYSSLTVGDYFVITNSNVNTITGYALTGITTSLGGMSNYPSSRVGTANSFIDGVYKVEYVNSTNNPQGIVTVTCHFAPVNGGIGINTSGVTTSYYGNYSWSKIINYDNRSIRSPLNFNINTNNGLIGLSTAHTVQRIPPLVF